MRKFIWILVLLCPVSAMAQIDLTVDLATDYRPFTEFESVRATLVNRSNPNEIIAPKSISVYRDDDFLAGRRVANFEVQGGSYDLVVSLRNETSGIVVDRRAELTISADFGITMVLIRPDSPRTTLQ